MYPEQNYKESQLLPAEQNLLCYRHENLLGCVAKQPSLPKTNQTNILSLSEASIARHSPYILS